MKDYEDAMKGWASGQDAEELATALLRQLNLHDRKGHVQGAEIFDTSAGVKIKVTYSTGETVPSLEEFDVETKSLVFSDSPKGWLSQLFNTDADKPLYVSIQPWNLVYYNDGSGARNIKKKDFAAISKLIIAALPKFTRV